MAFFVKGGQKRYFGEFLYGLEPVYKINAFCPTGEKLPKLLIIHWRRGFIIHFSLKKSRV